MLENLGTPNSTLGSQEVDLPYPAWGSGPQEVVPPQPAPQPLKGSQEVDMPQPPP